MSLPLYEDLWYYKGMNLNNVQVVIWKEGLYFVAQCLNVDVSSFGVSRSEALDNLKEALQLFFEEEKPLVVQVESPEVLPLSLAYA